MTQVQYPKESDLQGEGVYILMIVNGSLGGDRHRARYYIGWTQNIQGRLYYHRAGYGAHFTRAANQANLHYRVVAWIPGGTRGKRGTEGEIKAWKNTRLWIQRHPEYGVTED